MATLRQTVLDINRGNDEFWKREQDRIRKLSDDDFLEEVAEELARMHWKLTYAG